MHYLVANRLRDGARRRAEPRRQPVEIFPPDREAEGFDVVDYMAHSKQIAMDPSVYDGAEASIFFVPTQEGIELCGPQQQLLASRRVGRRSSVLLRLPGDQKLVLGRPADEHASYWLRLTFDKDGQIRSMTYQTKNLDSASMDALYAASRLLND